MTDLELDLMRMASNDAHALILLSEALDADETPDLPAMAVHCFTPTCRIDTAAIPVLCGELADEVAEWVKADEAEAATWAREILFTLFRLRHGALPCATCLSYSTELGQLHPREPASLWCVHHAPLTVHDVFAPREPLARRLSAVK